MRSFPSLCNSYYQSRDTRRDQRRVAVISTSMSIAATEAPDHPEAGRVIIAARRRSSDGRNSRHVRLETDAFSRTTNSLLHLLLLLFRLPPSKISKDKIQGESTDQPRLLLNENCWNECVSLPSIPRDLSLLSTHSRHGFAYEFLTVPRPRQSTRICAQ